MSLDDREWYREELRARAAWRNRSRARRVLDWLVRWLTCGVAVLVLAGAAHAADYTHPVDMVRDAQGNGRGGAAYQMAVAMCTNATNSDFRSLALGYAMVIGPFDRQLDAQQYFDGHFPGCMKSVGYEYVGSKVEADARTQYWRTH